MFPLKAQHEIILLLIKWDTISHLMSIFSSNLMIDFEKFVPQKDVFILFFVMIKTIYRSQRLV